jgi:hypothetical protein
MIGFTATELHRRDTKRKITSPWGMDMVWGGDGNLKMPISSSLDLIIVQPRQRNYLPYRRIMDDRGEYIERRGTTAVRHLSIYRRCMIPAPLRILPAKLCGTVANDVRRETLAGFHRHSRECAYSFVYRYLFGIKERRLT